jgi:hypothetical protein
MSAADSFFPGSAKDMDVSEEEFGEVYAYVDPTDTGTKVYTGPMLLKGDGGPTDPAGGIIVHELSHLPDVADCTPGGSRLDCSTMDGYIDAATGKEAVTAEGAPIRLYGPAQSRTLNSDQALFHASSYQMYVVGKPVGRQRGE